MTIEAFVDVRTLVKEVEVPVVPEKNNEESMMNI